jgi:hypothetical protein
MAVKRMFSFSDVLALGLFAFTVLLVVLDKTGKLKGWVLDGLLALDYLLCLMILASIPLAANSNWVFWLSAVGVAFAFSALRWWLKKGRKLRPIRITGFRLNPLVTGEPVSITVRFTNDSDEAVRITAKNSSMWIGRLPPENDIKAMAGIEETVWNYLLTTPPGAPHELASAVPVVMTIPPKADNHVDEISPFIVTEDLIQRLNDRSAIYFVGLFASEDGKAETPFCVRVDKFRANGLTMGREHN